MGLHNQLALAEVCSGGTFFSCVPFFHIFNFKKCKSLKIRNIKHFYLGHNILVCVRIMGIKFLLKECISAQSLLLALGKMSLDCMMCPVLLHFL